MSQHMQQLVRCALGAAIFVMALGTTACAGDPPTAPRAAAASGDKLSKGAPTSAHGARRRTGYNVVAD